jgi:hypothetical protein
MIKREATLENTYKEEGNINHVKADCIQNQKELRLDTDEERIGELKDVRTITQAGCQWLIPIILATQEAEIRRITI